MEIAQVPLDILKTYPGNPRKGNVDLIADSLATYGQYKPITVNHTTNESLTSNHTYQAARKLGWDTIAVTYVNVDETTAAKIVAIDNKTSDYGTYDNEKLLSLLEDLPSLAHTGYGDDDVDSLLALLDEQSVPSLTLNTPLETTVAGGVSNTQKQVSLGEYAERYAQKQTRMLMMDYENHVYIWVAEKLAEYRKQHNLENNSDALRKLLENTFNESAPTE